MTRIYLDHNATSPLVPAALETMVRVLAEDFGNASSIHLDGQRAKAHLDDARAAVAALIGAEPGEVVFTSGGTESDNFAIHGVVYSASAAGRRHVVVSTIEHEAVLTTVKALGRQGWTVTWLPVGSDGIVRPEDLASAVRPDTALVSIMHANNEVGTIQPIAEHAATARAVGAVFHTDAVQTVGKIPVDVKQLGVDLLSLSAHKFGGPKGAGALWIRRGTKLAPLLTGGRQERSRRAGTENVPAIAGLGAAARCTGEKLETEVTRLARLRDRLEQAILTSIPDTHVNGAASPRVPNTTNVGFGGLDAEAVLIALDLEGVAVSTGAACSSGTLQPSHVLRAMGLPPQATQNAIRFSLGATTTEAESDHVIDLLPRVIDRLRRSMRATIGAPAR